MTALNDHELTTLVEAAASGAYNSSAAHHGGPAWEELEAATKNNVREAALPFIFHGTKALGELGFQRPRTVITIEDLDALPHHTMIHTADGDHAEHVYDQWFIPGVNHAYHSRTIALPATVLWEAAA